MNVKKWGILLVILLFVAAIAVGCGGGNKTPDEEEPAGNDTLKDGVYEGVGQGYNEIKLEVTISGGKITAIEAVENNETADIGGSALTELIDAAIESQSTDVEVVSGATKTSAGFIEALENALEQAAR